MKNMMSLAMGCLFSIVSSYAIALHFETTIANKTNQALTIHCEDHACAYCDADMTIKAGQTIAYWTGYNTAGDNPFKYCSYHDTVAFLHFKDTNGKELYEAELHGSGSDFEGNDKWSYATTYMRDIKGTFSGGCTDLTHIDYASNSSIILGDTTDGFNCERGSL